MEPVRSQSRTTLHFGAGLGEAGRPSPVMSQPSNRPARPSNVHFGGDEGGLLTCPLERSRQYEPRAPSPLRPHSPQSFFKDASEGGDEQLLLPGAEPEVDQSMRRRKSTHKHHDLSGTMSTRHETFSGQMAEPFPSEQASPEKAQSSSRSRTRTKSSGRSSSVSLSASRSLLSHASSMVSHTRKWSHKREVASLPSLPSDGLPMTALNDSAEQHADDISLDSIRIQCSPSSSSQASFNSWARTTHSNDGATQQTAFDVERPSDSHLTAEEVELCGRRSLASDMGLEGQSKRRSLSSELGLEHKAGGQRRSLGSEIGLSMTEGESGAAMSENDERRQTYDSSSADSTSFFEEEINISPDPTLELVPSTSNLHPEQYGDDKEPIQTAFDAESTTPPAESVDLQQEKEAEQDEEEEPANIPLEEMDPLTLHRHMYPARFLETLEEASEEGSGLWDTEVSRSLDEVLHRNSDDTDGDHRTSSSHHDEVVQATPAPKMTWLQQMGLGTPSPGSFGWAELLHNHGRGPAVEGGNGGELMVDHERVRTTSVDSSTSSTSTITSHSLVLGFREPYWATAPPPLPLDAQDKISRHDPSGRTQAASEPASLHFEEEAEWVEGIMSSDNRNSSSPQPQLFALSKSNTPARRRTASEAQKRRSSASSLKLASASFEKLNVKGQGTKAKVVTKRRSARKALQLKDANERSAGSQAAPSPGWAVVTKRPESQELSVTIESTPAARPPSLPLPPPSSKEVGVTSPTSNQDASTWGKNVQARIESFELAPVVKTPRRQTSHKRVKSKPRE